LRIDAGLTERDKRADQLALANSAALAAALAAQKEAAGEAQKSAALAISKSEAATAEAIKQGQALFQTSISALTAQINELKSRLDRGEGGRTVSDPAVESRLASLSAGVSSLTGENARGFGASTQKTESSAWMIAVIGTLAALALVAVDAFSLHR
jgi:hypothetical protein